MKFFHCSLFVLLVITFATAQQTPPQNEDWLTDSLAQGINNLISLKNSALNSQNQAVILYKAVRAETDYEERYQKRSDAADCLLANVRTFEKMESIAKNLIALGKEHNVCCYKTEELEKALNNIQNLQSSHQEILVEDKISGDSKRFYQKLQTALGDWKTQRADFNTALNSFIAGITSCEEDC